MLEGALRSDSISVDERVGERRDAVEAEGQLLVGSGAVQERYASAMFRTVLDVRFSMVTFA